jgi:hypothetical protein
MSENAQSKYHATQHGVLAGAMVYPIVYDSLENGAKLEFQDAAEFGAFYATAVGFARSWIGEGADLKEAIRQAATHAAIDAVTDDR